jgi:hypothetical protein
MATLATYHVQPDRQQDAADPYRLRAIPNEDVYFFVKSIDNTRVVREADPAALARCWKTIAFGSCGAVLLISLILPGAYNMLAGYQIQALHEQRQHLTRERAALEMEEASLVSAERLQELARMQQFIDPAPGDVVHLNDEHGDVAMNAAPGK